MTKHKTDTIERRYWSISRVAKELKIFQSKIRFWEKEGLVNPIKRKHHSNPDWESRFFNQTDFERVKLINALRNFGIEIKLIKVSLKKEYAQELLEYLKRMK